VRRVGENARATRLKYFTFRRSGAAARTRGSRRSTRLERDAMAAWEGAGRGHEGERAAAKKGKEVWAPLDSPAPPAVKIAR
jgi:hypothetical protein